MEPPSISLGDQVFWILFNGSPAYVVELLG